MYECEYVFSLCSMVSAHIHDIMYMVCEKTIFGLSHIHIDTDAHTHTHSILRLMCAYTFVAHRNYFFIHLLLHQLHTNIIAAT
jgi:hypothetical protein